MKTTEVILINQGKDISPPTNTVVLMPIGGKATRAQPVTDDAIPKHLIPIGNKTVIDIMCENLQAVGFRKFVFCVGHHKEQINDHLKKEAWIKYGDVEYTFSEENTPLGVDGAILNAITSLNLQGQGLIIPGDMMLPWKEIALMNRRHGAWRSDVTVGVTSYITERSGDIGKIIVEEGGTDRILWCYARDATFVEEPRGSRALTCAAPTSINMQSYAAICNAFIEHNPEYCSAPFSMRDNVIPWATRTSKFTIHAYDLEKEALDLGTPLNILYAQKNWRKYA